MDQQPPQVRVRRTTSADLPELVGLWNDGRVMAWVGFPDGLGHDLDAARSWLDRLDADPNRHHFVLEHDEVGFAGELFYAVEPDRRRAGLDIKLRPEAQGRGIARAGLRALCDLVFAAEPGVDAVWVEPSSANVAAHRLYTRCGFARATRPADLPAAPSYWELRRPEPGRGSAGGQAGTASSSGASTCW